MAKTPTIAELMAEIDALKRKVAALERAPVHHFHHQASQFDTAVYRAQVPQQPAPPWTVTCGPHADAPPLY